ncbi:MAG: hypothetical protein AAGI37_11730 [Planctomycetota bacterium]
MFISASLVLIIVGVAIITAAEISGDSGVISTTIKPVKPHWIGYPVFLLGIVLWPICELYMKRIRLLNKKAKLIDNNLRMANLYIEHHELSKEIELPPTLKEWLDNNPYFRERFNEIRYDDALASDRERFKVLRELWIKEIQDYDYQL